MNSLKILYLSTFPKISVFGFIFLVMLYAFSWRLNADPLYSGISEEISQLPESSSSKRSVALFNSPLSTSVITAQDISRIGATSIPEALRLAPGVLVKEVSNGLFAVHIRGFDNAPTGGSLTTLSNQNTLVMIDGRVVYDYFLGGLFWETLPVNMNDIERIEIIRGPSTALYGPNAVMGVIHIFTKRSQPESTRVEVSSVVGNYKTRLLQLALENSFHSHYLKLNATTDERDRYQTEYFSTVQQQYLPLEQIEVAIGRHNYPSIKKAKDTRALSLTLYNDPTELLAYDLNYSHHESWSQKAYISTRQVPLTTNESDSDAVNFKVNYDNIYARTSYHTGKQKTLGLPDFDYQFDVSQTNIEYVYQMPAWIIRPGFRYDDITYDGDFIGGKRTLANKALMLRSEVTPNPDTHLTAALSYDKYNSPDKRYFNYQFLASYRYQNDTRFRIGIEKANRSSFFLNSFLDLKFTFPSDPTHRSDFTGNKDAPLMSATTYEVGLRHEFSFYNWLDIEFFHTNLGDQSEFIRMQPFVDGLQTVVPSTYQPTPTESIQRGITADWHYESIDWDMNLFITLQHTDVSDQYSSLIEPITYADTHNQGTPAFYGGANLNWQFAERWNLNANSYFMDESTIILEPLIGSQQNDFLVLASFTLKHQYSAKVNLHTSIKNLANINRSQHFYTDKIRPTFQLGIDISWGK